MTQSAPVLKPRPGTIGFLGSHDTIDSDKLGAAVAADSDMFPTSYFQITEIFTPMTLAAFNAQFIPQVQLVGTNQILGTLGATATNFVVSSALNCNFFLKSIRIVLIAEPEQFALTGASFPRVPGPQRGFDGTFPIAPPGVQDGIPATCEYGKNTLIAVRKMLESYDFEFTVGCDYPLVQTSLARVGCVQLDASVAGAGSPLTAVAKKVQDINIKRADNGHGDYFQWQNLDGAGEVANAPITLGGLGGSTNDLMCNSDGWYDIRNGQGIVLPANQSFQAMLVQSVGNARSFAQFQSEMTEDSAAVTPHPDLTSVVAPGGVPIVGSNAGVITYKGGLFKYGIELRGAKIRNKACFDWATNYGGGLGKPFFDDVEAWDKIRNNPQFQKSYEAEKKLPWRSLGEAVEAASGADKLDQACVPPHQRGWALLNECPSFLTFSSNVL